MCNAYMSQQNPCTPGKVHRCHQFSAGRWRFNVECLVDAGTFLEFGVSQTLPWGPYSKNFLILESVLSPAIWENYHLARTLLPRNAPQRQNPSTKSLSGNSYLWDNPHNSCIHNTRLSCKADHRMTRFWKSFDRPST